MLRRSLVIAASTAIAQAIVAVLYIVAARAAGPEQFGAVVAAIAAATFLAGLFDFGTNNFWVREVSSGQIKFSDVYARIAWKGFFIFIAGTTLALLASVYLPETSFYATGILGFSMALFQSSLVPLKASLQTTKLAIIMTTERVLAFVTFLLLSTTKIQAHEALVYSLASGSVLAAIISLSISPRPDTLIMKTLKPIWPWRGSLAYGMGGVTISAQTLDATILHAVAGPIAAGTYGAVNRWTQPLGVFASAFATTGLPYVARSQSLRKSYKELKHAWWLLGIAGVICILVAALSPLIVKLLLGAQYADSAAVLSILAIGTIPALINQPLYVFMQAMNLDKKVAPAVIFSVLLQLALCAALGLVYAELGAAIALALGQAVLLSLLMWILTRQDKV